LGFADGFVEGFGDGAGLGEAVGVGEVGGEYAASAAVSLRPPITKIAPAPASTTIAAADPSTTSRRPNGEPRRLRVRRVCLRTSRRPRMASPREVRAT
jgi:hypothetical protein